MKRFFPLVLVLLLVIASPVLAGAPAWYQTMWAIFFTGSDGQPHAVTPGDPLPVVGTFSASVSGGSSGIITNLASDSAGNLKVQIASVAAGITIGGGSVAVAATDTANNLRVNISSASALMVASISVGIAAQFVGQVATNANTILADITSGTAAPFWMLIRNTGSYKIHMDSVSPNDNCEYIGPGEQFGPVYCGSNVLNDRFKSNSAGISSYAITIRK